MSNHTKAQWSWQAESESVAYLVESDDATIIARLSGGDGTNNFSRAAANARRIVACVNACEGIETEELNEYCAVSAKEYQDLERQRDELLAALNSRKWPVMGYGQVAISGGIQPDGVRALLYLDMGETRTIGADTTDLFQIGSVADASKLLVCVKFKDSAAIQQTIDVLKEMQDEIASVKVGIE